jgi:DNA replication protein DnaC
LPACNARSPRGTRTAGRAACAPPASQPARAWRTSTTTIRACQAGLRVLFATAAGWVARLADAHHGGRLQAELIRLGRYPLIVIDEVGYIPFEPEAANLFFQLVSSRYERASLIVTSNKPFGRWGEVFGDDVVAAAMIDRLVHHAEVISLKGDSYRLKDRDLGRVPAQATDKQ